MKALVTGARGFIGSSLVEHLLERGLEVACLLREKAGGDGWIAGLDFQRVAGDITQPETLPAAVADADLIFHLAGCTKAIDRAQFDAVNIDGTRNLLSAIRKHNSNIKRVVLVSSLAAAGPSPDGQPLTEAEEPAPVSNYGWSKLGGERVALEFADELPITIVRPPGVYGPRDTDVFTYFKYAKLGFLPVLSGGTRTASFIFVKDLTRGILRAGELAAAVGKTYYLCDDQPYSWDELGETIAMALKVSPRRVPVPVPLAWPVAAVSDLVARTIRKASILNLDKYRELKMKHWVCSNALAKKELGFGTEVTLAQGIAETADWYQEKGWL